MSVQLSRMSWSHPSFTMEQILVSLPGRKHNTFNFSAVFLPSKGPPVPLITENSSTHSAPMISFTCNVCLWRSFGPSSLWIASSRKKTCLRARCPQINTNLSSLPLITCLQQRGLLSDWLIGFLVLSLLTAR